MKKSLIPILLIAAMILCGVGVIVSRGFLSSQLKGTGEKEQDLYLPDPVYLKFIAAGHDGLVSDLVLAKAMTYYGSHYRERGKFTFKHLKKLFFTAIEMDPLNIDACLLAGNILSEIDIHGAIEILKLGMRNNPESWKFPEMIGFKYWYKLKDSKKAARYYEIASHLPGHPPYIPSISGKLYEENGRYNEAIRVLYNFYSTTQDKRLKESFKQSILELQERINHR